MLVENGLSWDNEREATAVDWPPLLTPELEEAARQAPPRQVMVASGDAAAGIGFGDDGRIVIPADPDLTEAELRATSIDSMVGAAFLPYGTADDDAASATDVVVERPRRFSRSARPLILMGAAVAVGLSAGYAANAAGWRLPPAVLESAQPVTTFFGSLKTARLVDLTEKLRLEKRRLVELTNDIVRSGEPKIVQPPVGPMSDLDQAATEPMSLLEESRRQDVVASLAAPGLAPQVVLASDEGAASPVRAALLGDVPPSLAGEPTVVGGESRRGGRSARRESHKHRARR